jgi:FKBP-type peptidyl-prolyl cis-trans isomerase FklB
LGEDLKRDNLEAMPEVLLKGVTDALSGAKPQFKPSERRKALVDIKNKRAQENLERSQAFLAENAKKEGVVTLPSGLQYKEVRAGEGKTPGLEDRITVNYRGTLVDASEFDSSYQRGEPSKFEVKRVIKGWREALQLMKEGAKWELVLPPELAYGKSSPNKRIPPNSALIFEVELLSVEPAPPARNSREGLVRPMPREIDEE